MGLACDNLRSADVVTADGGFLTASETENADLFWGLRGGGGNFGIVHILRVSAAPRGASDRRPDRASLQRGEGGVQVHRDFSQTAPDELFCEFDLGALPDGQRAVFLFCYVGPPEEGEKVLAPPRAFGAPLEDLLAPTSYCELQRAFDEAFPFGLRNYWKSSNVAELSDAIDTMVAFMESAPSIAPMVIIDQFGGEVARIPNDGTAFGHREAAYDLIIAALWAEDSEQDAHIEWARSFWEAMQPYSTEDVYVNYLSEEGDERVRAAYGHHYERLVELKPRYDPRNVFRSNQNISPDG